MDIEVRNLWQKNYMGETEVAKSVRQFLKPTYKGDIYIPWQVMVRSLYTLDPEAEIIKCTTPDGGYVFTQTFTSEVYKDGVMIPVTSIAHFVRVQVKYLNKLFDEIYPIQDKAYGAPKFYDQNAVNKAMQRALARCISTATGVGFSVYENGELQFEDDGFVPTEKPLVTAVTEPSAIPSDKELIDGEPVTPLEELVTLIMSNKDNPNIIDKVTNYNDVLNKNYGFMLSFDDDFDTMSEKLGKVKKPETMLNAFKKVLNAK